MRRLLLLWASCGGASEDPCSSEGSTELEILCRVQASAQAAARGEIEAAEAHCEKTPAGLWREECFFRAGESLAPSDPQSSLRLCGRARRFRDNCVTHSVWVFPRVSELEGAEAALSLAALEESVLDDTPELSPQALSELRAGLWWSLYQGSGSADPAAARSASEGQAAAARTAWASELYRLDPSERAPSELQRLWEGEEAAVRGDSANSLRPRHSPGVRPPGEEQRCRSATYGGGARLCSELPEEDLPLAWMAAAWAYGAGESHFRSLIQSEHTDLRDQAIDYSLLSAADPVSLAESLLSEHPEQGARIREALGVRLSLERRRRRTKGGSGAGGHDQSRQAP